MDTNLNCLLDSQGPLGAVYSDKVGFPLKRCQKCRIERPLNEFTTCRSHKDGKHSNCNPCKAEWYRDYRSRNVLKERARVSRGMKKWARENRAAKISRDRRQYRATPRWAKRGLLAKIMKVFYSKRPPGYHVDHIIPLKGKHVSGLHVPWNLQYLPAAENIRKHNRF